MLDEALVLNYANTFYGHGSYTGPFWFIGLEEGGGDDIAQVKEKLTLWQERGSAELDDLHEHHYNNHVDNRWFGTSAQIQRTWAQLIRIMAAAQGTMLSPGDVLAFQKTQLGRNNGSHALMELMPLPSPNTRSFTYADHLSEPQFRDRAAYHDYYAPRRIQHIQQRLDEYHPACVVLYSSNAWSRGWWGALAGTTLTYRPELGIYSATRGDTLLVVTKHPVAHGTSNAYYEAIGKFIGANTHPILD